MTQYSTVNVKLSHSQLSKSKSGINSGTEVMLNHLSNVIGNSNDETNLVHNLSLANRQVSRLCKVFANNLPTNIKYSKTRLSKMVLLGRFIFDLMSPLGLMHA